MCCAGCPVRRQTAGERAAESEMTGDWTLPCVQPSGLFPAAEWRSCSSAAPPCGAWENWLWWLRPPAGEELGAWAREIETVATEVMHIPPGTACSDGMGCDTGNAGCRLWLGSWSLLFDLFLLMLWTRRPSKPREGMSHQIWLWPLGCLPSRWCGSSQNASDTLSG